MSPPDMNARASVSYHEGLDAMTLSQLETFTRWWNGYLEDRGHPVTDLIEQIKDGVLPFRLIEALEGFPAALAEKGKLSVMGKSVIAKPRLKVHKMENLTQFLSLVEHDKGIKVCAGVFR